MKYIIALFLLCGCLSTNQFNLNDCVQKADEVHVWKIVGISDNNLQLSGISAGNKNQTQEASLNGSWIITSCQLP